MYYFKYDNKLLGPLAPDNPKHDFNHIGIYFKALKWAQELGTDYEVLNDENSIDE